MFPGGTPFGFYNAPVSKALLVVTGAASAVNILLPALKFQQNVQLLNYFQSSNILLGLLRTFYYSNAKNLFFGSLLLYSFRIFEHRYGSTKFANYILASTVIGTGLRYTTFHILLNEHNIKIDDIQAGPFGIIFSLFVPFYLSIPSVASSKFLGLIPVTSKLFTYIIGLQMMLLNKGAFLFGVSGLVAGVACHLNILYVQQWLKFPDAFSNLCGRIFGAFFQSSAPVNEGRIHGATIEIQRQQRMDELDQQLWRLQETNATRRRPATVDNQTPRRDGQGYPDVLIGNPNMVAGAAGDQGVVQQPTVEVLEEQVQRLIEMGFSRQTVLQALTASNNNMAVAMNILLAE